MSKLTLSYNQEAAKADKSLAAGFGLTPERIVEIGTLFGTKITEQIEKKTLNSISDILALAFESAETDQELAFLLYKAGAIEEKVQHAIVSKTLSSIFED